MILLVGSRPSRLAAGWTTRTSRKTLVWNRCVGTLTPMGWMAAEGLNSGICHGIAYLDPSSSLDEKSIPPDDRSITYQQPTMEQYALSLLPRLQTS